VETYCRAGQATDGNMAYENYMLDTKGYRHTLGMIKIYCFSTASTVKRKLLNVLFIGTLQAAKYRQNMVL